MIPNTDSRWHRSRQDPDITDEFLMRNIHDQDEHLAAFQELGFTGQFYPERLDHLNWGCLAPEHVPLVIEMLQSGQSREVHRVLDLGCGDSGHSKEGFETVVRDALYLDRLEDRVMQLALELHGKDNGVTRNFQIDSKDTLSTVSDNSIGLVLRVGVRSTNACEMDTIGRILAPDGELVLSNYYTENMFHTQPIAELIGHVRRTFNSIDAYLGEGHYLLHCRRYIIKTLVGTRVFS